MSDALWYGRRFRTFKVVDDSNREVLAMEVDFNLPAARVVRPLEHIAAQCGYPLKLRLDNGPELISLISLRALIAKGLTWVGSTPALATSN